MALQLVYNYDTFYTIKYKGAYIHCKSCIHLRDQEIFTVQIFDVRGSFYTKEFTKLRSAKIFITKQSGIPF